MGTISTTRRYGDTVRRDVTDLGADSFTFGWTFLIERDGTELTWETTFRVRTVDQVVRALEAASFSVTDIRDNHIFVASREEPADNHL